MRRARKKPVVAGVEERSLKARRVGRGRQEVLAALPHGELPAWCHHPLPPSPSIPPSHTQKQSQQRGANAEAIRPPVGKRYLAFAAFYRPGFPPNLPVPLVLGLLIGRRCAQQILALTAYALELHWCPHGGEEWLQAASSMHQLVVRGVGRLYKNALPQT